MVIACTAPLPILHERVNERQRLGHDPSQASASVVDLQMRQLDPIDEEESAQVMELDTSRKLDAKQITHRIAARLGLNWR